MRVKALTEIEDYHDVAMPPDATGAISIGRVETMLKAGDVADLDDVQAQRLIAAGLVSTDMDAPLARGDQ